MPAGADPPRRCGGGKSIGSSVAGSVDAGPSKSLTCPQMSVEVHLTGRRPVQVSAGADTWAGRNLLSEGLFKALGGRPSDLKAVDTTLVSVGGEVISGVLGRTNAFIRTDSNHVIRVEVFVLKKMGTGTSFLIGDPGLRLLAKTHHRDIRIRYHGGTASAIIGSASPQTTVIDSIEDRDCIIRKVQSGESIRWEFEWRWVNQPPNQRETRGRPVYWKQFDRTMIETLIGKWAESSLEPCEDPKFLIPINPVPQDKVDHPIRITGDFKQFNKLICSESTESSNEVCAMAIRAMRAHTKGTFLDISKAYQSVSLSEHLRDYNAFKVGNRWLRATQMLFGIGIGQKVLYLILKRILRGKTLNYRDDIFVPESESTMEVIQTLSENGFVVKPSSVWSMEELEVGDEPRVTLGLEVFREENILKWRRKPITINSIQTARDLASALGEAGASHLPCLSAVSSQLAILRSLLGKYIGGDHTRWDVEVPQDILQLWTMTERELLKSRSYQWEIPSTNHWRLYADASKFLIGGVLRAVVDGQETDDLADFCKIHHRLHINMKELDSVILGLQLVEEYSRPGATVEIFTDSRSCFAWVQCAINDSIVRTKALNKSLIKARLEIIKEMISINKWRISATWIDTHSNPADAFTRVPAAYDAVWRRYHTDDDEEETSERETEDPDTDVVGIIGIQPLSLTDIRELHQRRLHPSQAVMCHLVREEFPDAEQIPSLVREVCKNCEVCLRKKPANKYINLKDVTRPICDRPWQWSQIDTLTISQEPLIKVILLVDEYSRFCEYRLVQGNVRGQDTVRLMETWYSRYQPRSWHIRADRGREFLNKEFAEWVEVHGGKIYYSTARRPTACGIVERLNRTMIGLLRVAKHMFPEEGFGRWMQRAVQEYWTRPHRALRFAQPNQVVYQQGELQPEELSDAESYLPSETDSESEGDSPAPEGGESRQRILIFRDERDREKLDFPWEPATMTGTRGDAVVARPEGKGRHETTVNQRWFQTLDNNPIETGVQDEGTTERQEKDKDASVATRVKSNRRACGTPKRYM